MGYCKKSTSPFLSKMQAEVCRPHFCERVLVVGLCLVTCACQIIVIARDITEFVLVHFISLFVCSLLIVLVHLLWLKTISFLVFHGCRLDRLSIG